MTFTVDPDCPAPRHNTLRAAQGKETKDDLVRPARCVCRQAIILLNASNERKARKAKETRPTSSGQSGVKKGSVVGPEWRHVVSVNAVSVADLTDTMRNGKCRTAAGFIAMDRYMDAPQTEGYTEAARYVCAGCPAFDACGQYVTRLEKPAGAWHGMYAGMTPRDRREAAAKREAAAA